MFSIFPRNPHFGPKYHDAVIIINKLATTFHEAQINWKNIEEKRRESNTIENDGDIIIRDIILSLNESFITPFDREDMYTLADRLDDIADGVNHLIEHLDIYRINDSRPYMKEFSELYIEAGDTLEKAITHLFDKNPEQENIEKLLVLLTLLSNKSSELYEGSIERLFVEENDPVLLIKWENLIREMHEIMHLFKKVSHTIESIVMKVG